MTTKLTKRNEDFVFHLEKLLKDDEMFDSDKTESVLSDIKNQLSEAQKSGTTAKQLFDTPSQYLADLKDPKAAAERKKLATQGTQSSQSAPNRLGDAKGPGLFDFSFLDEFVDTALSVFVLFSVISAFAGNLFSSNPQAATNNSGFVTIILVSILGGWLYVTGLRNLINDPKNTDKVPRSFIRRLLFLLVLMAMWIIGFLTLSLIPQSINPVLPALAYIALGILGFLAIRFWRQRTGLPNSLLSVSVLMRNSGARARDAAAKNKK